MRHLRWLCAAIVLACVASMIAVAGCGSKSGTSIFGPFPTQTPTHSATPKVTPTATASATHTAAPTATSTSGATSTATSTASSTSTPTATATASALWVPQGSGNSITSYAVASLEMGGNVAPAATISGANTTLSQPECLAFDGSGNLWATNFSGASVVEFTAMQLTSGGNVAPHVTISGSNTDLNQPVGCAFDSSGNLWVANFTSNLIEEFSTVTLMLGGNVPPTVTITGANTGLCSPSAIAFDSSGNLWVVNNSCTPPTVIEFSKMNLTLGGNVAPSVVISGGNTTLSSPFALAFDGAGDLWVANQPTGMGTVQTVIQFSAANVKSGGNVAPSVTFSGANTGFNLPDGLVFDAQGDLWVSNGAGNTLDEFESALLAAGGNVAPTTSVAGAATGLNGPFIAAFH